MAKKGRPTKFTSALAEDICVRLSCGESLRSICEDPAMPSQSMVMRWLARGEDGEAVYSRFREQYVRARETQQDTLMDECLDIADDSRNDWMMRRNKATGEDEWVENREAVSRARLRVDTRMRMAERMAPKKYGQKMDLSHGLQPGNPLEDIMRRAAERPLLPSEQYGAK